MEPKEKTKEIIHKILSCIKQKVKTNTEYKSNNKKLYRVHLISAINKKRRSIIDITKRMNFKGEVSEEKKELIPIKMKISLLNQK